MNGVLKTACIAAWLSVGTTAHTALAGDGRIDPPGPTDTSTAQKISLSIGFAAPIPPPEMGAPSLPEHAIQQLKLANQLICDVSDGQFRISDVTFLTGETALTRADVLWFPQDSNLAEAGGAFGRGRALQAGPNGMIDAANPYASDGHVKVYGYDLHAFNGVRDEVDTLFFGGLLAHELTHALFGLRDQYADQRGAIRTCPVGASFENPPSIDGRFRRYFPSGPEGVTFADFLEDRYTLNPDGTTFSHELMQLPNGDGTFRSVDPMLHHTIMQTDRQVCRDALGRSPSQYNPVMWQNVTCLSDGDCADQGAFSHCTDLTNAALAFAPLANEMTTDEDFDLVRGDLSTVSDALNPNGVPVDGVKATEIVLQATLNPGFAPECHTPELGQLCTSSSPSTNATTSVCVGSSLVTQCLQCLPNQRTCPLPSGGTCGNGTLDAGEDCDTYVDGTLDATVVLGTCGDALTGAGGVSLPTTLDGGAIHCNPNCTFDLTECSPQLNPPLVLDPALTNGGEDDDAFEAAANTDSNNSPLARRKALFAFAEVLDGTGDAGPELSGDQDGDKFPNKIDFSRKGKSSHGLYVYAQLARRFYDPPLAANAMSPDEFTGKADEDWLFTFAMDDGEFVGGTAGNFRSVKTVQVRLSYDRLTRLNTRQLTHVDGVEVDPASDVILTLGAVDTPALIDKPAGYSLPLKILLDQIRLEPWSISDQGATAAEAAADTEASLGETEHVVRMYARAGTFVDAQGRTVEAPQYRECHQDVALTSGTPIDGALAWNATTRRYESTASYVSMMRTGYTADPASFDAAQALTDPVQRSNALKALEVLYVQSDWARTKTTIEGSWPGLVVDPPPAGAEVQPDVAAMQCPEPIFHGATDAALQHADEIVFVLDRTGSMSAADVPPVPGVVSPSRLDYVKSAAQMLVEQYATASGSADATRVGFVWYNEGQYEFLGKALDTAGNPNLRKLVSGDGALTNDEVSYGYIASNGLRPHSHPDGEAPLPEGSTATAAAIDAAKLLFTPDGDSAANRVLVLLTDGETNTPAADPANGVPEPSVAFANSVAGLGGINLFIVPTSTGGKIGNYAAAISAGGEVLEANVAPDVIPRFFEIMAAQRGQGLALNPRSIPESYYTYVAYPLQVEEGARELVFMTSDNRGSRASYAPNNGVYDPTGTWRTDLPPPTPFGRYWLYRIPNPDPGPWWIAQGGPDLGTPLNPGHHVAAFIDNPDARCVAEPSSRVTDGSEPLTLNASAFFKGARVTDGVTFTAYLMRPDRIEVPIEFAKDPETEMYLGSVSPDHLVGRGVYQARVRCEVSEGAVAGAGEPLDGQPPKFPTVNAQQAFIREVNTAFFLDVSTFAPLPGETSAEPGELDRTGGFITDTDRDTIANADEPPGDFDGDGVPNARDSDADNDDTHDSVDPDPYDPNVPEPPDPEHDGVPTDMDNCPTVYNPSQDDYDGDGIGDECDENSIVADAGIDLLLECTGAGQALAILDGTGSGSPDGIPNHLWSAPVNLTNANQAIAQGNFPLGTNTATLTVSFNGDSKVDATQVTVRDTTAPTITIPADVVATSCTSVNLGQASGIDSCGGTVAMHNDAPSNFKAGVRIVNWWGVDARGNASPTKQQRVTVLLGDNATCCPTGANVIQGTTNNDVLNGTAGVDCIIGRGGQDTIKGFGSGDFLSGGDGNDNVEGGDGNDFVQGGTGQDNLNGQTGDDVLYGNDGDDICNGSTGNDVMSGGQGQDRLYGEANDDSLYGDDGDDRLEGAAGNDLLNGGGLHDTCIGGTGTNTFVTCEVQQ